ncbi:MAG TPA: PKD domain-containing protein, partial [Flavobacteriales bacterium]|nr:PKD domain-containing protein [Flavobacteriales bacterium]
PVATGVYNFGDGTSVNGLDASHTYITAGVWDIQLTVTSPDGCVDDTTMVALIESVDSPTVLFTSDTLSGCMPLAVQFTNNTDPNYVGSCAWDFGDGGVGAVCDPLYTFTAAGVYTVTLTVTTPWGCTGDATIIDMITVYQLPTPSFTAEPDSGCYPLEVTFSNTTAGIAQDGCYWTFGDGAIGAPCDPVYVYPEAGVYNVSLAVISPEGCHADTLYPQLITVFDHPVAHFGFGPQPTDFFEPQIMFFDSSSADAILWDWAFGEGGILGTSTVPDPTLEFPGENGGEYPVTLIVTNSNGCMDTTTRIVVIDGYFSVFVPNSFTPDDDGVNDLFLPAVKDQDPQTHHFAVYDRWGERIFETSDATHPWDGTVGGSKAKEDVYVWQVESTSVVDGKRRMFLGHVSLLR